MNRLGYIDALRGIGIILLVYNHFLFFGCSGGMSTMTPLDNEVMFILMPLFFCYQWICKLSKRTSNNIAPINENSLDESAPASYSYNYNVCFQSIRSLRQHS